MNKLKSLSLVCLLAVVTISAIALISCKKEKEKEKEKTLVSIAVTVQPTKKIYEVNDTFDPSGMTVTATYSDKSTAPITVTVAMLTYDFSTAGANKTVIITYEGKEATVTGITVNAPFAPTPVITITEQPSATTNMDAGCITGNLTVAASVTKDATLNYQWYVAASNSNAGGKAIDRAKAADFAIPTDLTAGTYYYFCELGASGGAASVRSDVATVSVEDVGDFCSGSGTSDDPYRICSAAQLAKLSELSNTYGTFKDYVDKKYFILTADIDLDIAPYNTDAGFTPINSFTGHFDGNNHKITGLYITGYASIGLFRAIEGSVQNLGVEGTIIAKLGSNGGYVGGITGQLQQGASITNCYFKGTITNNDYRNYGIGGLVGSIQGTLGGSITNCFTDCEVNGGYIGSAGGVVGSIVYVGSVTNCYAMGTVSCSGYAGGVVGWIISNGSITNCYATGAISSEIVVGGMSGLVSSEGSVTNCAALNRSVTGPFAGNTLRISGALDGYNVAWGGMLVNGTPITSSDGLSVHGKDITNSQTKTQKTYEDLGWKFGNDDDNPWKMGNNSYPLPVLYWQAESTYSTLPDHLK